MHSDAKTGILLIIIGLVATMGLIFISGKQAAARGEVPNAPYGFGYCVYKTAGDVNFCYDAIKRLHTDNKQR